jgi:exopolysaccharide production protein ExoQ
MNHRRDFFEVFVLVNCAFFLTGAITTLFMTPGATPLEGNLFGRMTMGISYIAVAVMLVAYRPEVLIVVRRNWALAVLVLLGFVSSLWAETPELSFRRCGAAVGTTLLGVALAIRLTVEEQLRLLSWLFRILAILSLACIILFPAYGIYDTGEWQGVFGFKNFFGSMMAVSILIEWQLPTNTRWSKMLNRAALVLSAVLLIGSNSITSLMALVGAFVLVEIYKFATLRIRMPLYATVVATLLIFSVGFVLVAPKSDAVMALLGRTSERTSDLTGRTEIWRSVIPSIQERPILGYGYAGFWTESASAAIENAIGLPTYSHNGFLDTLLTNGALGLSLALVFVGTGLKRAFDWSLEESHTSLWPLAFLSFFLLYNIGECAIFMQHILWALCVAAIVGSDLALFAPETVSEDEFLWTTSEAFK